MFYLQFGGSSFDEATDDLLHPLGVPHVDRCFLKLRHLHGDTDRQTDRQTEVTAEQAASPHRKPLRHSTGRPQLKDEPALIGPSRTVLALWHGNKRSLGGFNLAPCEACPR